MNNPLHNAGYQSAHLARAESVSMHGGNISNTAMIEKALSQGEASVAGLETVFDGRVIVSKAENGFVVTVAIRLGARHKSYVAADMDEVNRLLTSIMVDFRLTGGK